MGVSVLRMVSTHDQSHFVAYESVRNMRGLPSPALAASTIPSKEGQNSDSGIWERDLNLRCGGKGNILHRAAPCPQGCRRSPTLEQESNGKRINTVMLSNCTPSVWTHQSCQVCQWIPWLRCSSPQCRPSGAASWAQGPTQCQYPWGQG